MHVKGLPLSQFWLGKVSGWWFRACQGCTKIKALCIFFPSLAAHSGKCSHWCQDSGWAAGTCLPSAEAQLGWGCAAATGISAQCSWHSPSCSAHPPTLVTAMPRPPPTHPHCVYLLLWFTWLSWLNERSGECHQWKAGVEPVPWGMLIYFLLLINHFKRSHIV